MTVGVVLTLLLATGALAAPIGTVVIGGGHHEHDFVDPGTRINVSFVSTAGQHVTLSGEHLGYAFPGTSIAGGAAGPYSAMSVSVDGMSFYNATVSYGFGDGGGSVSIGALGLTAYVQAWVEVFDVVRYTPTSSNYSFSFLIYAYPAEEAVPEPSTWFLCAGGLAVVAMARRRA